MKLFVLAALCCGIFFAGTAGYASAADGEKIFSRCARCHGDTGDKAPHALKGQDPAVLVEKLKGFAGGTYGGDRKDVMGKVVKGMSEADMEAVAKHIGTF